MRLTREQFVQILADAPSKEVLWQHNARGDPRVPLEVDIEIVPVEYGSLGTPLVAAAIEISAGGLSFISPVPRPIGGKFILKLPTAIGTPLAIRCVVRHCRQGRRVEFHIGAVFESSAEGDFDVTVEKLAAD